MQFILYICIVVKRFKIALEQKGAYVQPLLIIVHSFLFHVECTDDEDITIIN